MGVRLLAHSAPEPTTHSLISVAEDLGVLGLLALAYSHPWVAIPVLVGIILAAGLMLPLLFRVLRFLLSALAARLRALFDGEAGVRIPLWARLALAELDPAGGGEALRVFARKVKGSPRLKAGFLARPGGRWTFIHKGLARPGILEMDDGGPMAARVDRGLFWDTLILLRDGRAQVFLVTKDCSGALIRQGIPSWGESPQNGGHP
jgi:hypothetical protein